MSLHQITDLGPPRIHSVVAARSAAVKIRQLSSSLFAERRKKLDLYDQGDFAVTFSDDPANPQENVIKPRQEERQRGRRSTVITPAFTRESAEQSIASPDSNNNNLLEPKEASLGRRSTATFSSGLSDPFTDTEVENASRQGDASPRQRRRRFTVAARPPTTISIEHDRFAEPGSRNTYRLEPDNKFEHWKVTAIIKKIFEDHLLEESYDQKICSRMSKTLADLIKEQVKSLQFSRYKIICIVSIGQKRGQSVRMASRSVWDPRFDGYAQYSYEKGDMYAIGVVHAIYFE